MSLFSRFFGLEQPTEKAISLVRIMTLIMPTFAATFTISTTFWMIYIAESLGGGDYIAGLTIVSSLVILQLIVQTLFDYPTGALGDHIGQRFVIASAMLCYGASYWITSISDATSPIVYFALIYVLNGLGQSQESGAWGAWFDNNYRVAMPHDKDRKMYGVMSGRMGMVFQVVSTLVLLPGSWLALLYGRTWVFKVQAIVSVLLCLVVLRYVRDFPEAERIREEQNSSSGGYLTVLGDGLRFLVSDKFVFLTILGGVIIYATGTLWWQLLLFPFYFTYLLTDVAVAAYRTIAFVPNVAAQERSGIWSRRFDPVTWIPRFRLIQFCGFVFYLLFAGTMFFFPPPAADAELVRVLIPFTDIPLIEIPLQSIVPLIIVLIIFAAMDFFGAFAEILTQRVMLDVIPNRIRNSMYSLQPTLSILCAMPLIWIFGNFLPIYGFVWTFLLISLVSLAGAILIRVGFAYPIPKADDLEKLVGAEEIAEPERNIEDVIDIIHERAGEDEGGLGF